MTGINMAYIVTFTHMMPYIFVFFIPDINNSIAIDNIYKYLVNAQSLFINVKSTNGYLTVGQVMIIEIKNKSWNQ